MTVDSVTKAVETSRVALEQLGFATDTYAARAALKRHEDWLRQDYLEKFQSLMVEQLAIADVVKPIETSLPAAERQQQQQQHQQNGDNKQRKQAENMKTDVEI